MKRIYQDAKNRITHPVRNILTLTLIALTISSTSIFAAEGGKSEQNTRKYSKISVGKKFKLAKSLVSKGVYITAAQYLDEYLVKKPTNHKAIFMAAKSNEVLRDYVRAEKYYKDVLDIKPSKYPLARYDYGRMLKYNGKYDEAKKQFKQFSDEYSGENKDAYLKLVKNEVEGCDYAMGAGKDPKKGQKVEHVNGSVNNELTEYAPKYIDDNTLLYASFPQDTAVSLTNFWKNKKDYRSKIYTSTGSEANWDSPSLVDGGVNDPKFHCGNAVISADGQTMYFTKCSEDKMLNMVCKIFSAKKDGGKWGEPKELSINVTDGSATSTEPALATDANGNTILYFVSNREGGLGGMDIWLATIDKNGSMSTAKNAGKAINTFGDELSPYYDAANTKLYFSSNGHKNLGGFDVFVTKGSPEGWDTIQNMGMPVNSSADDIYLALDPMGEKGYMISNRVGAISPRGATCCDDIFTVYLGGRKLYMRGYYAVKGDATNKPVAGVDNSLFLTTDAGFDKKAGSVTYGTEKFVYPLDPCKKYKINGTKSGFYPAVDNIDAPCKIVTMSDTIDMVFYLNPIIVNKVKVENVYFVFNKSGLDKDRTTQKADSIGSFLMNNPNYGLEISGFTDSKGSDAYNDKLSQRRAQAIADYLINTLKISKDRVIVKAMGEKAPIAENEFADGRDNPTGRAKNRRVMFKLFSDDNKFEIMYDNAGPATDE